MGHRLTAPGGVQKLHDSGTARGGVKGVKFHPDFRSWWPVFDPNYEALQPFTLNIQ